MKYYRIESSDVPYSDRTIYLEARNDREAEQRWSDITGFNPRRLNNSLNLYLISKTEYLENREG